MQPLAALQELADLAASYSAAYDYSRPDDRGHAANGVGLGPCPGAGMTRKRGAGMTVGGG